MCLPLMVKNLAINSVDYIEKTKNIDAFDAFETDLEKLKDFQPDVVWQFYKLFTHLNRILLLLSLIRIPFDMLCYGSKNICNLKFLNFVKI